MTTPTKARKWARTFLFAATLGLMGALPAGRAHAEIKLLDVDGWTFSTDGRINNFLSHAWGDWIPEGEPSTYGGIDDWPDTKNKINSTRIRSGFIMNVLGFELNKQLTEGTHLKTRVALWALTAAQRSAFDAPAVEARELYFKLEGNWGGLLVGRSLALFARGGIMLDYDVEHGMGLGFPCATKTVGGGACGHAGFGLLFPGFHSGFVYNTPSFGGLQFSVGVYDPVEYASATYHRTPYPRPEAEIAYASPNHMFTAFASGLWQRLGATLMPDQNGPFIDYSFDAYGVNYGAGLNVGPLKVAVSGFTGKGLGLLVPVEDNPAIILSGRPGLRSEDGYWGAAALVFGGFKIAGGAGITRSKHDDADPDPTKGVINIPYIAQQLGFSGGIYQQAFSRVTFALEYFDAQITWFDHALADGSIVRPRQNVNFVNLGATLVW